MISAGFMVLANFLVVATAETYCVTTYAAGDTECAGAATAASYAFAECAMGDKTSCAQEGPVSCGPGACAAELGDNSVSNIL